MFQGIFRCLSLGRPQPGGDEPRLRSDLEVGDEDQPGGRPAAIQASALALSS
jgi:hypothetical protein